MEAAVPVEFPVEAPVAAPVAAPVSAPEKKVKKPLPAWIFIVAAVVLVAAIVVACLFIFGDTKINLNEYLSLKDDGYDGFGTVEWEINWKKLKRDYGDKLEDALNKDSDGYVKKLDPHEMLETYVSVSIENNKMLKNGDEITYTWKLDKRMDDLFDGVVFEYDAGTHTVEDLEEPDTFDAFADYELEFNGYSTMGTAYGYSYGFLSSSDYIISKTEGLANGDVITVTLDESVLDYCMDYYNEIPESLSKEYTVSGLPELVYFDPFENLTVEFDGYAPFGDVSLSYDGDYLSSYDFEVSQWGDLSNGDTITISLSDYEIEDCLDYYGAVPTVTEKTYTVSGLSGYVTKLDQIDADSLAAMKSQAEDVHASIVAGWDSEAAKLNSLEYLGEYLVVRKSLSSYSNNTKVYLVYKQNATVTDGSASVTQDVYWYVCFNDLYLDGSNTLIVDLSDYTKASQRMEVDPTPNTWNYWIFYGYESLDSFYTKKIQVDLSSWTAETNIVEVAPAA